MHVVAFCADGAAQGISQAILYFILSLVQYIEDEEKYQFFWLAMGELVAYGDIFLFHSTTRECGCQTLNMVGNIALLTHSLFPLYTMGFSFPILLTFKKQHPFAKNILWLSLSQLQKNKCHFWPCHSEWGLDSICSSSRAKNSQIYAYLFSKLLTYSEKKLELQFCYKLTNTKRQKFVQCRQNVL